MTRNLPYETAIGRAVQAYLTAKGWEVYPEVALKADGRRADLVAVQDEGGHQIVWVIECKRGITGGLIRQLWHWRDYADRLSVGVPERWRMGLPNYDKHSDFEGVMLDKFGFGLFAVKLGRGDSGALAQFMEPVHGCRIYDDFLYVVDPAHRQATPGQVDGKRFTALDATLNNLTKYVKANPGCSLREAVKGIRHHYANNRSAQSSLGQWLRATWREGRVPDIKLVKRGGRWYCELKDMEGVM